MRVLASRWLPWVCVGIALILLLVLIGSNVFG